MRTFLFSILILLSMISPLMAEEKTLTVFSEKIQFPPLIDGNPGDPCWKSITFSQYSTEKKLTVKACHDSENVYILLTFPAPSERRHQNRWIWNNDLNSYLPGAEEEESLHVFISGALPSEKPGDLWIWRAGRTDPSGFAEDLYFYGKDRNIIIKYDSGTICWYSRYFGKFAGERLPRFFQRAPSGSAADVRARGKWSGGKWTIEFARKLKTGNNDDLDIDLKDGILIRFAGNISENTAFFILRGKPER